MVNKKILNRHNKKIQADLFGNLVKDFSSHKVNILAAKSKGEFRVDKYLTIKWEKGKTFIRGNSLLFELNNPEIKKEIEQYVSSPEYNSKDVDTRIKSLTNILEEFAFKEDQTIDDLLNEYVKSHEKRHHLLKRKSLPLNIDKFWEIIKISRKESKNNSRRQEKIILKRLSEYAIEDIYVFEEIFHFYHYTLVAKWDLAGVIVRNIDDTFFADDSWNYFCSDIVALGRNLYTMALFDSSNFIKELKSGKYGHPRYNIGHESYIDVSNVLKQLIGISFLDDGFFDLKKEEIKKARDKIKRDLNVWFLNKGKD